jgi:hypothetical protein
MLNIQPYQRDIPYCVLSNDLCQFSGHGSLVNNFNNKLYLTTVILTFLGLSIYKLGKKVIC